MDKITGHGHPSKRLKGEIGQWYEDLDTGDIWECRLSNPNSTLHGNTFGGYLWVKRSTGEDMEELYGGGGSGLPEGGEPYKQLVTDGEGVAKWEDRLAYEHAQTVTWDGDVTSPRYTSYSETKGAYRFLDDIPEKIVGLKVIGRCVQKATGETRKSETVIDSDTHVSTEGDVTYYSYIHATFDFGGELPVSANLELTINESDKEDWPRGVTGGYKVSVMSGETYIIYIESLEFPPTVKPIDPKYLPEGVGGGGIPTYIIFTEDESNFMLLKSDGNTVLSEEEVVALPWTEGMFVFMDVAFVDTTIPSNYRCLQAKYNARGSNMRLEFNNYVALSINLDTGEIGWAEDE